MMLRSPPGKGRDTGRHRNAGGAAVDAANAATITPHDWLERVRADDREKQGDGYGGG